MHALWRFMFGMEVGEENFLNLDSVFYFREKHPYSLYPLFSQGLDSSICSAILICEYLTWPKESMSWLVSIPALSLLSGFFFQRLAKTQKFLGKTLSFLWLHNYHKNLLRLWSFWVQVVPWAIKHTQSSFPKFLNALQFWVS